MVVVPDQASRLKFVNQCILFVEAPVEILVVIPQTVKPDRADRPVVRQQFRQLIVHETEVAIVILLIGGSTGIVSRSAQRIIGAMPIQVRIIEMKLDILLLASYG